METDSISASYESKASDGPLYDIRRFALKYKPPTLIIEYAEKYKEKLFVRKIRFKHSALENRTAEQLADKIIHKNSDILSEELVSYQQLVDLIKLLLFSDISETNSLDVEIKASKIKGGKGGVNGEIDLNKVSSFENAKAKEIMSETFNKKMIKPTDKDYVYDKRVDFEPPQEVCEWDEDD